MTNELIGIAIEIMLGAIIVPFCVWVTVSIFALKQQQAVMRSEMNLMKEIRDWMQTQRRVPN